MSTARNRWLNWKPKGEIFSNSPEMAPTKTSKMPESEPNGVFDVFDGSSPAKSPKIEGVPDATLKGQAIELWCDRTGGRVFIVADEEDAQEATRRFSAPGLDSGTRLSFLAESRIRPSAMKLQPSSGNWIANFRLFRRGPMARSITASEG